MDVLAGGSKVSRMKTRLIFFDIFLSPNNVANYAIEIMSHMSSCRAVRAAG